MSTAGLVPEAAQKRLDEAYAEIDHVVQKLSDEDTKRLGDALLVIMEHNSQFACSQLRSFTANIEALLVLTRHEIKRDLESSRSSCWWLPWRR